MQIYVPIKIIIFLFNIYKQFSHIADIYKISRFFSKKTSHLLASQLNQSLTLQIRGCRTDNTSLVTFLVLILICQFRFFHAKRGCTHIHTHIHRTHAADCKFHRNIFDRYRFEAGDKRLVRQHNYAYGSRATAVTSVNRWPTRETITLKPDTSLPFRFDEK